MKKLIVLSLMLPIIAMAEITPQRGPDDPRVRVVEYNAMNVVKLSTFFGVSTHIQFGDGEVVKDIAVGDDLAWKVISRTNNIFIKPLATNADTNVTVITSKRTYQFALIVQPKSAKDPNSWKNANLIYSLKFKYPEEERSISAAKANAEEVKSRLSAVSKTANNMDYWVKGSEEISPTAAHDDGRFIYLTFSNNRDMPAVYSIDSSGNEALINTNVIDGNTIVIQRMVQQIMLRKGDYVAAILNKSFDMNTGADNTTGTVSSDVDRVIKGVQ